MSDASNTQAVPLSPAKLSNRAAELIKQLPEAEQSRIKIVYARTWMIIDLHQNGLVRPYEITHNRLADFVAVLEKEVARHTPADIHQVRRVVNNELGDPFDAVEKDGVYWLIERIDGADTAVFRTSLAPTSHPIQSTKDAIRYWDKHDRQKDKPAEQPAPGHSNSDTVE